MAPRPATKKNPPDQPALFSLLTVAPASMAGVVFPIRRDLCTIGRDSSCEVVLDDDHVSNTHAELRLRDGRVWLTDTGSTNGTFHNGSAVDGPVPVRLGDQLRFGAISVRVTLADPSEAVRSVDPERPLDSSEDLAWADDRATWADDDPLAEDPAAAGAGPAGLPEGAGPTGSPEDEPATVPVDTVVAPSPEPADERTPAPSDQTSGPGPIVIPDGLTVTPRPKTILVSHARADRSQAELIVRFLKKKGHRAWIDRSTSGDGWGGRLLDVMWSCDAAIFVVSADAAGSARVHREIHLAGAERVPVLPVAVSDSGLPPDLDHYLSLMPVIDLVEDPIAALNHLGQRIESLPRRWVRRPRLRAAQVAACVAMIAAIWMALGVLGFR